MTTSYGYDIGNRLAEVTTTSGSVTQVRRYTRDNRSFLLVEQHPEKGSSGNGQVKHRDYDARGHAHRRTDTPNDLTYVFDRAERLVSIRETWGQQRVLKSFDFAESNGASDWRRDNHGTRCTS